MSSYQIKDDRERLANQVKERLLYTLFHEGFLTDYEMEYIQSHYAVVFRTQGWFGRAIDKLFGNLDENRISIEVMKVCCAPDEEPNQAKLRVVPFKKEEESTDEEEEQDT